MCFITPLYLGKFCSELADSDVSVFLLQEGKQEKLIGFTEAKLEEVYISSINKIFLLEL